MKRPASFAAALVALTAGFAMAEAPNIKSDRPLIHLADNLDEKDRLGWCIDTEGRGFSEILHAHSCKPAGRGMDTQFSLDAAAGHIRSVPYDGKCMTLSRPEDAERPFGLFDCEPGAGSQMFSYDADMMEIRHAGDGTNCVAVAAQSSSAGPFMSRRLIWTACDAVEPSHKQWVVVQ